MLGQGWQAVALEPLAGRRRFGWLRLKRGLDTQLVLFMHRDGSILSLMRLPKISAGREMLDPPRRAAALFNKPAAGNAGIAPRLTIGHYWPGVPEPER